MGNSAANGAPIRTLVVNLYGGPGTGKSTSAAAIFAALKMQGRNAELATEYAKDIVWEGRDYLLSDQLYIFAKQNRKLERLYGKVEVVVSDSPLLLSYHYSRNEHILGLVREMLTKAEQLHVFLIRKKAYRPEGRYQTEDEARELDGEIATLLDDLGVDYVRVVADGAVAEAVVHLIDARQAELTQRG